MKRGRKLAAAVLLAAVTAVCAGAAASGLSVAVSSEEICPGTPVIVTVTAEKEGTFDLLLMGEDGEILMAALRGREAKEGENAFYWNGTAWEENAPIGPARLVAVMDGEVAEVKVEIVKKLSTPTPSPRPTPTPTPSPTPTPTPTPSPEPLTEELLQKGQEKLTPAHGSPREGEDRTLNYWTAPMDITDEETVWKVLMSPVTVVNNGKKTAEKEQIVIRSEPSEESAGVGMVTCVSQGVHVLERGEEWALIECYSSSFHDSKVLNWNALVQGYVPAKYLKEILPNPEMGLVVDKLSQKLYIFREGKLFSTLNISTGLTNRKQPYNETRSGEFLLVSKVGEFSSDNMKCAFALRFNDGDLLHEVPYISYDGFKDYSTTERHLGTKASHGCIRVPRKASPEGVNQVWLWNHYKKNTKILIWEDWQGRQIPLPAADTPLYADKKANGYYHASAKCSKAPRKPAELTYGELEDEAYRKLKPCPDCAAPKREETIREINERYAEGGDHDPVLTEALETCPREQKGK